MELEDVVPPDIGPDDYDPDYSDRDEFQPAMQALAHFILQWNLAELYFKNLLSSFGGELGSIYSVGLGNQSKIDALLEMAEALPIDNDFRELIRFACKAFGIVKSNRNALAHAHTVAKSPEEEKPHWIRQPKNPKSYSVYVYADADDVMNCFVHANALCALLMKLHMHSLYIHGQLHPDATPSSLPEKYPLPKLLTPHSLPRSDLRPQPQS